MPDATLLEERPLPMIEQPKELLKQRDTLKEKYFAGSEDKAKIYQTLDNQVRELELKAERGEAEAENEVPKLVLRGKEDWTEFGWTPEKKREVEERIKQIFNDDFQEDHRDTKEMARKKRNSVEHILEMLVAQGLTPDEALGKLTTQAYERVRGFIKGGMEKEEGLSAEEADAKLERYHKVEIDRQQKMVFLQDVGIQNADYLKKFVFDRDYAKELSDEYRHGYVDNLYSLAWNIGFAMKEDFGIDGKYPILQMQVDTYKDERGVTRSQGRYVVNQGNFMRWIREQMWKWYDFDTDDPTDYFQKMKVDKGNFTAVTLMQMLFEQDTYFRDETGHKWTRLYDQTLLEPWIMMHLRQYHLGYRSVMGSEERLAEAYNKIFELSKLTRKVYQKSMIYYLTTLPTDFDGKDSDTGLGEAWTKIFLAYYNFADFDGLQKILGTDSDFFKKKGWIKAIKTIYDKANKQTGMPNIGNFLGEKSGAFAKAFDKNGEITTEENRKNFTDFVNIFTQFTPPSTLVEVVSQALKDAVAEQVASKEGNSDKTLFDEGELEGAQEGQTIDTHSLNYAWLIANSWTLFSGLAARNNFPAVSGHNAETKWQYTRDYRLKYIGYTGAGKIQTVHMYKKLMPDFLHAITVENADTPYTYFDEEEGKNVTKRRKLTPFEIFMQMHEESNERLEERRGLMDKLNEAKSDEERETIRKQFLQLEQTQKTRHKLLAQNLEFNENIMWNFAQNNVARAKVLYEQVFGAHEIDFEKYAKHGGVFRGVTFDRAGFQKDMQSGFITPLRYLVLANGNLQLNMKVREPVFLGKNKKGENQYRFEEMYLGEAMFGHEILDIPEFRMDARSLSREEWEFRKENGYKRKGNNIVRPDGQYEIDYNKVQDNKAEVYKQWALMKFAADLWSHIDRHSTDPTFNTGYYISVVEALESLSGELEGDEYNMKNAKVVKPFFSHHQMEWLKKKSKTTMTSLLVRQVANDLFVGDHHKKGTLFGEAMSIFVGTIFKGY